MHPGMIQAQPARRIAPPEPPVTPGRWASVDAGLLTQPWAFIARATALT